MKTYTRIRQKLQKIWFLFVYRKSARNIIAKLWSDIGLVIGEIKLKTWF